MSPLPDAKSWDELLEREERKAKEDLVILLIDAIDKAKQIDMHLMDEIETAVKPIIERRLGGMPTIKCGRCGVEMTLLEYTLNQGTCGPCIGADYTPEET